MKRRCGWSISLANLFLFVFLSARPVAGWSDHGGHQHDVLRGWVNNTKATDAPSANRVWAVLHARHGAAREGDANHRDAHGNFDAVSVERLEATSDPQAGINPDRSHSPKLLAQAQAGTAFGTPTPDQIGQWSGVIGVPVVPIFTTLLPTGKVLMWDSVGDAPAESYSVHDFTRAAVWDPGTGTATRVDVSGYNLFCSGFAHMVDGNVFVAGGNKDSALNGIRQTHIFDFATSSWSRGPDMALERWYPSVAALANGEHFVMGGGPDTHEVRQTDNTMRTLNGAVIPHLRQNYPFIQTGPDGRVIYAGPQQEMRLIDTSGAGSVQSSGIRDVLYRSYGSYALYDVGKILVTGGAASTNTATVISMIGSGLSAAATSSMIHGRRQHNSTVLPDGSVLVTGGLSSGADLVDLNAGVYAAELWNPASGAWRELASAAVTRQYHSVALLLPDGRVLTGGGGICSTCQQVGYLRKDVEIFSPPYLFKKDGSGQLAPRPAITSAPSTLGYGQSFSVGTPDAATIAKAALIRLGSPTHGQDQDQRYLPVSFSSGAGVLTATSPVNANVAPPGYYMLFLVNAAGVPSIANIVRLAAVPVCKLTAAPPASPITTGQSSTLTAECTPAATSYAWTGGACAGSTAASCTVRPTETTNYTVAGINSAGTGTATGAVVTVCSYSIPTTSQAVAAIASTGTLNVISQANCAWAANSNVNWITLTAGASGNGNGTVAYAVPANPRSSARTGTMTIAGQTFTVTQAGAVTFNSRSDCLFGWAERTYPSLFAPAGSTSLSIGTYYYRAYTQPIAYLGTSTADNRIYYVGPLSNNQLFAVGDMSAFLSAAGCQ